MDDKTNLREIKDKTRDFTEERDWDQYHNAKDLATALILEAAELLEHFRYKSLKEVEELFSNKNKREEIEDELGDIMFSLFRIADKYEIDLASAFDRKLDKTKEKYPIDKVKGKNRKYNEY